ncbi:SDR family oxidoreductase [Bradyrhizobium sp. WSM 1738]|uniref:SDR family oxidoreductase n=1 Tax=Bradyrhizobium hereditatis TaxID=2821405 RepID=UPI001CE322E5|nr:SDR family oxidoreductase [Bradyrhizobium hereditatis]MCA6116217.1 SDR family oxidoreductase [Bradyrhizobium hereditatis]
MSDQKTVLILGGSSDIGYATALRYAEGGWRVWLAARDLASAQRNADDVTARSGQPVTVHALDVLQSEKFVDFVAQMPALPDTVISVIGELGDQKRAETDSSYAAMIMRTNFEAPSQLLDIFAGRFQARGTGTIVGVSSVAGDRGRGSNYFYGAAKAGFSQYLSGLRNRMSLAGKVRVVTVKPGFVRTRMTAHLKLPASLTVTPDRVASDIYGAAEENGREVIYVAKRFWLVMTIICLLPEPLFKRLKL